MFDPDEIKDKIKALRAIRRDLAAHRKALFAEEETIPKRGTEARRMLIEADSKVDFVVRHLVGIIDALKDVAGNEVAYLAQKKPTKRAAK
jgi:hypothetical protein